MVRCCATANLFLGSGFLDAYRMAESRPDPVRDVCAITVSPSFYSLVSWSEKCCRLLCLYEDHFFIHPYALSDPDMGEFDKDRILKCLKDSGTNEKKLTATKHFLEAFEDYDDALLPNSRAQATNRLGASRRANRATAPARDSTQIGISRLAVRLARAGARSRYRLRQH